MRRNTTVEAQVSNIDIFPTLLDLMGLNIPAGTQGLSFKEVLMGISNQHRNEIFAEAGRPEYPPPPMDINNFCEYKKARHEKDGSFWFVDYTGKGRAAMIRRDNFKYCYYVGDREELYDLCADPLELINLAENSEYENLKNILRKRLFDWSLTTPFV